MAKRKKVKLKYANLPAIYNVGELKAVLAGIPDEFPVNMTYGYKPVVFNESDDPTLCFEDNDGTWD